MTDQTWADTTKSGCFFVKKHITKHLSIVSPVEDDLNSFLKEIKDNADKARYWDNRFSNNCLEVVITEQQHKELLQNQKTEQDKKNLQMLENIRQQYILLLDGKIGVYQFALSVGGMFD